MSARQKILAARSRVKDAAALLIEVSHGEEAVELARGELAIASDILRRAADELLGEERPPVQLTGLAGGVR